VAHLQDMAAAMIADRDARLVLDLTGDPSAWLAWWDTGANVIAVSPLPAGYQPEGVTVLTGDPRDRATQLRVVDQMAGRDATVLVMDGDRPEDAAYVILLAPGGLLLAYIDGGYAVIEIERQ
jgi:hypothetical protein